MVRPEVQDVVMSSTGALPPRQQNIITTGINWQRKEHREATLLSKGREYSCRITNRRKKEFCRSQRCIAAASLLKLISDGNGSEVCIVGMQRNNFLELIKVIKQCKFYLNLCFKVILYYKSLNLHAKSILFSI